MSCCSDKVKVFERKNGKVLHEFVCSSCSGYITVKLDEDLNGAHCVVCPSCSHEHYRIIKDGAITEDRAPSSAKSYAIRICPTKAAYSKDSWEAKLASRKTKTVEEGKHFLNDAWKTITGKQKQTPPEKKIEVTRVESPIKASSAEAPKGIEPPKPSMKTEVRALVILDALIAFCATQKSAKVTAEDYECAALWRDYERKIKLKKEGLNK
jgi:hypothetical protein